MNSCLKGNKSHGIEPMHLQEVLRHNHLQLQLISRLGFTKKTLLNTQHIIFMGPSLLLDNKRHDCHGHAKFIREMKVYSYTPILIPTDMIWPCCLRPNSTYFLIRIYVCTGYTFTPTRVSSQGRRTKRMLYTRLNSELLINLV